MNTRLRMQLLLLATILLLPHVSLSAEGPGQSLKKYQKANKLFAADKYREALPLYQEVLAAPPDSIPLSDIHTRIADGHFRMGNYRKALESYRSALRHQKRSERPATQYWIGFCCFLLGRDDEAVAELLKIPELYPDSGMWVSTAYYWAGRASERLGRKDLAADYYRRAGGRGKSAQEQHALKRAQHMNR